MPKPQSTQKREEIDFLAEITRSMADPSPRDVELVRKALRFVEEVNAGKERFSGEPNIVHLAETALILAELGGSAVTVAAGLLHDILEDSGIKREVVSKEFGDEIVFLIEGTAKLGALKYKGADRHNESLRKLFVAISEDIRVLLVKLACRLHNMRTLVHVPKEKQERLAHETLEIYAPIAYRLGIRKINRELEDLSFPYVYPKEFEAMKKILKERHLDRSEALEKFSRSVKKALAKEGLTSIKTEYRVKGLYSLYKKYLRYDKDLEKIYDLNAMRILVDSVGDCYRVLGTIHARWKPLPGRIKDYISNPKLNGYQALHTTVFTGDGNIVEMQIKTHDMHKYSEYGVASHLSYKSGSQNKDVLAWVHALLPEQGGINIASRNDIPHWIRELAHYEEPSKNYKIFREGLKSDFFSHRIFVFSPKGDVVDLPIDSTPIDFAYYIHSDIGNKMSGAKINGKLVSLETKLRNGDIVHIETRESAKPNRKWLDMAKTSLARRHIRHKLSELTKDSKN